jgi:N-acyl-D-aspartate/D-glutamate deacylase
MQADLVIRGGTIIDGTGAPPCVADIASQGDQIVAIGELLDSIDAPVLDAQGLYITPGFIDIHSHSDFTFIADPRAVSAVTQGVTFELVGNCGHGCAPIANPSQVTGNIYGYLGGWELPWRSVKDYLGHLEQAQPAINVATLVPNGNLRLAVVEQLDRPATLSELRTMQKLLSEGLDDGALGFSTGLEYTWEQHASPDEVTELCRVAAKAGTFYATHTRNRPGSARDTIDEAINTAADAGASLQISHIASVARLEPDSTRAVETAIELVERARGRGQDVSFDMHTRLFGTTNLSTILPPWALEGDCADIAARLKDRAMHARFAEHPSIIACQASGDWSRIVVFRCRKLPEFSGKSVAEISAEMGVDPYHAMCELLLSEIDDLHALMIIAFCYKEADLHLPFRSTYCAAGSDATALAPDGPLAESTMHGAYTWAAWFFHHFVTQSGQMTPQEAIRRMTSLPAERIGLARRGVLRAGAFADLAIFDPLEFKERGTTFMPNQTATGMVHVLVNGQFAVRDGKLTSERAGRVIRSKGD